MKAPLRCLEVARASLGEPVRQEGQESFYHCPNPKHIDRHPSLQINRQKNVWICGPCDASGNAWQLAAFISGLDPNDKSAVASWLKGHGILKGQNGSGPAITVDDLARDKQLPAQFLRGLGLKNIANGVLIPYQLMDASPAPRHRVRTALVAKEGSRWDAGESTIVPYGLERVSEAQNGGFLVMVEGESDCWTLWHHGFPALGIPGAMMTKALWIEHVTAIATIYIFREPDNAGEKFVAGVSKRLMEIGWQGRVLVVTLDGFKDPNELHKASPAEFRQKFQTALDAARPLKAGMPTGFTGGVRINPWSLVVGMNEFLGGEEEPLKFMLPRVILKGTVVEVFSPRGLCKSIWANYVEVLLAKAGFRVLLIDRDNPRRTVKERLRAFGATADLPNLKILSRENAPPLTDTVSWREFPYADFDLVILDSLDSAVEGVGEQDSAKPSMAIAPLLNIAHRENGPAVLVLGNCIKTGAHSRGSGVIEDRADIVFEVRDATSLRPSGEKPWVEELPPADAGSWISRSLRRKQREKYRLAFIATKFRVGEEPDPFILEIDLTSDPWSVLDITDAVGREGKEVREQRAREKAETLLRAREAFVAEIHRRRQANEGPMLKDKQAIPFLMALGLRRNAARELLNDPQGLWELRKLEGVKGHPVRIFLPTRPGEKDGGGNVAPTETAFPEGFHNADFCRPHPEPTAEIPTPQEHENKGATEPPIPAVVPIYSGPFEQKSESKKQISNLDLDDELTI